jgi:hypothetical protein
MRLVPEARGSLDDNSKICLSYSRSSGRNPIVSGFLQNIPQFVMRQTQVE